LLAFNWADWLAFGLEFAEFCLGKATLQKDLKQSFWCSVGVGH
jgi:hypothetical protein